MQVLHERKLRLSAKKTRIGSIDKGFHFLGIQYPETQPLDNTHVAQTVPVISILSDMGRVGAIEQIKEQSLQHSIVLMQGLCEKHANKSNGWLQMGFLPDVSEVT